MCNMSVVETRVQVFGYLGMGAKFKECCSVLSNRKQRKSLNYKIAVVFNAFCRIVSCTAVDTERMLIVSVACVRLIAGMS